MSANTGSDRLFSRVDRPTYRPTASSPSTASTAHMGSCSSIGRLIAVPFQWPESSRS